MKRLAVLFLFCVWTASAQYLPSKAEQSKLEKQRAKVVALQVKASKLQTEQVFEAQELMRMCKEVAAKNQWPADVTCNPESLVFVAPPPKPQIPPPPKEKDEKHN